MIIPPSLCVEGLHCHSLLLQLAKSPMEEMIKEVKSEALIIPS